MVVPFAINANESDMLPEYALKTSLSSIAIDLNFNPIVMNLSEEDFNHDIILIPLLEILIDRTSTIIQGMITEGWTTSLLMIRDLVDIEPVESQVTEMRMTGNRMTRSPPTA